MEEKVMNQEVEKVEEANAPVPVETEAKPVVETEPKTPLKIRAARWVSKHRTAVVGITTGLIGTVVGAIVGGGVVYANHKDDYGDGFTDGVNSIEVTPEAEPIDVDTTDVEV